MIQSYEKNYPITPENQTKIQLIPRKKPSNHHENRKA